MRGPNRPAPNAGKKYTSQEKQQIQSSNNDGKLAFELGRTKDAIASERERIIKK